jgi:integrase
MERTWRNNVAETLGYKNIKRLKRLDIIKLFNEITERAPGVANRCVGIISSVLNIAVEHELVEHNVCKGIKKNRETKRKRYYTPDELKRIFKALDARSSDPKNRESIAFIKLLIYTGARCGEIANARWCDLHGDKIILKEHKTDDKDDARVIHLNPQAKAVINSLERKGEQVSLIGINRPRGLWYSIRKEAGCPDLRLHDLRHSFASYAFKSKKVSGEEVGNLLGHKSMQTTMRYMHIMDDTAKQNAKDVGKEIFNSIN